MSGLINLGTLLLCSELSHNFLWEVKLFLLMADKEVRDDSDWCTLPELDPTLTSPSSSSNISLAESDAKEVDPTELDVLWLKFLSSRLLPAGSSSEECCSCRRSAKTPEHTPEEPHERQLIFKPLG